MLILCLLHQATLKSLYRSSLLLTVGVAGHAAVDQTGKVLLLLMGKLSFRGTLNARHPVTFAVLCGQDGLPWLVNGRSSSQPCQ